MGRVFPCGYNPNTQAAVVVVFDLRVGESRFSRAVRIVDHGEALDGPAVCEPVSQSDRRKFPVSVIFYPLPPAIETWKRDSALVRLLRVARRIGKRS